MMEYSSFTRKLMIHCQILHKALCQQRPTVAMSSIHLIPTKFPMQMEQRLDYSQGSASDQLADVMIIDLLRCRLRPPTFVPLPPCTS